VTTEPPEGAALERVTVPVALALPPVTLVGLTETAVKAGAFTVSVAVFETPL